MSRCVSLNHARANASANSAGFWWKRRETFSYAGSMRSARSVVSMTGECRFDGSCASATAVAAEASVGTHWCAPAGLLESFHSYPKSVSK